MLTSILIDATHLGTGQPTGVEAYVESLLPPLTKLLLQEKVAVTWVGHGRERPASLPDGAQWLHSAHSALWSQRTLPTLLKAVDPELFFTPSGIPPLFWKGKTAMTVHDLAAYVVPDAYSFGQRFRLRWLSERAARHAGKLIVPSLYTAAFVKRFWHIPDSRIDVVPHGPTLPEEVPAEALPGLEPGKFFIFVSRIERKKNLLPVIGGFAKYAAEHPGHLVLAGKEGRGAREVRQAVGRLSPEIRARIHLPGYITAGQKRWLMEESRGLLVPSAVEGFGMPILEGFAARTAVICAQAGSLPEVAQNAVLYAQADIPTDWYLQMQKLENADLRRKLITAGEKRLEDFSWERAAEGTAGALLSLG